MKKNLILKNTVGIVDEDYRGEIFLFVKNIKKTNVIYNLLNISEIKDNGSTNPTVPSISKSDTEKSSVFASVTVPKG